MGEGVARVSDDSRVTPLSVAVLIAAMLTDACVWGAALFQMFGMVDTGEPLWLLFALSVALYASVNAHFEHMKSR